MADMGLVINEIKVQSESDQLKGCFRKPGKKHYPVGSAVQPSNNRPQGQVVSGTFPACIATY